MSSPLIDAAKRGNKVSGPAQVLPLDRDVLVLRKINLKKVPAGIIEMLAEGNIAPGVPEYKMPWFSQGYISNDLARHPQVSKWITREVTKGFAVARTDTGEILKTYTVDELAAADYAVENARTELAILVNLEDEVEDEDDEDEDLEDEDDSAGL